MPIPALSDDFTGTKVEISLCNARGDVLDSKRIEELRLARPTFFDSL
jgi:hypothetical protein